MGFRVAMHVGLARFGFQAAWIYVPAVATAIVVAVAVAAAAATAAAATAAADLM